MSAIVLLLISILGGSLLAEARPLVRPDTAEVSTEELQPQVFKKTGGKISMFLPVVGGTAAGVAWIVVAFFLAEWSCLRAPGVNKGMLYLSNGEYSYHIV